MTGLGEVSTTSLRLCQAETFLWRLQIHDAQKRLPARRQWDFVWRVAFTDKQRDISKRGIGPCLSPTPARPKWQEHTFSTKHRNTHVDDSCRLRLLLSASILTQRRSPKAADGYIRRPTCFPSSEIWTTSSHLSAVLLWEVAIPDCSYPGLGFIWLRNPSSAAAR